MIGTRYYVPWRPPVPDYLAQLTTDRFALLAVDMQNYWANPQMGVCAEHIAAGRRLHLRYYLRQLGRITRNLRTLTSAVRSAGGHVFFTRVQSTSVDGRDMSAYYRTLGIRVPRGSRETAIVAALRPSGRDIVLSKPGSGSFFGTPLEPTLRNLGVDYLVIGGVMTDGCVESTVREAADRSFRIIVVGDACATWSRKAHEFSLRGMGTRYADIRTTNEVLAVLRRLARGTYTRASRASSEGSRRASGPVPKQRGNE